MHPNAAVSPSAASQQSSLQPQPQPQQAQPQLQSQASTGSGRHSFLYKAESICIDYLTVNHAFEETRSSSVDVRHNVVRQNAISKQRSTESECAACSCNSPFSCSCSMPHLRRGYSRVSFSSALHSKVLDEQIVTPFAQILATLHAARNKYAKLINVPSKNRLKHESETVSTSDDHHGGARPKINIEESPSSDQSVSVEFSGQDEAELNLVLAELDWCLDQLETVQSHKSLSEMASTKFKRLLQKELTQVADGSGTGNQIAEYIASTYTDKGREEFEGREDESDTEKEPTAAGTGGAAGTGDQRLPPDPKSPQLSPPPPTEAKRVSIAKVEASIDSNDLRPLVTRSMSMSEQLVGGRPATFTRDNARTMSWRCKLNGHLPRFEWSDEQHEKIVMLLRDIDAWGFDVFTFDTLTLGHPLVPSFFYILEQRQIISLFRIPNLSLLKYALLIEQHYHNENDVPYHNAKHATDVMQSVHVMFNAPAFENIFNDLEIFAAIFAAAIHDVDHPGVTQQYLVNTSSELAIMYNDESVLENHHLAVAFRLLHEEGCDVLVNLQAKQRQVFRAMVIEMVRATDMTKHMALLADLKTMVEAKKVSGSNALVFNKYNDRMLIAKNLVHCADLSNPTKPLGLYALWVDRIMTEFFNQGDLERQKGIDVSAMCDRKTASVEKSQVSFIDYVVEPLWETWAELVDPFCQSILDTIAENRKYYAELVEKKDAKQKKDAQLKP